MIVSRAAYYKAVSEVLAEENEVLKEKNKRLEHTLDEMQINIDDLHAQCMELEAEKEALIKTYKECQVELLKEFVARMKAESIIVFDTPTKENFLGAKYAIDTFVFDKLVNETVGDSK